MRPRRLLTNLPYDLKEPVDAAAERVECLQSRGGTAVSSHWNKINRKPYFAPARLAHGLISSREPPLRPTITCFGSTYRAV